MEIAPFPSPIMAERSRSSLGRATAAISSARARILKRPTPTAAAVQSRWGESPSSPPQYLRGIMATLGSLQDFDMGSRDSRPIGFLASFGSFTLSCLPERREFGNSGAVFRGIHKFTLRNLWGLHGSSEGLEMGSLASIYSGPHLLEYPPNSVNHHRI